MFRFAAVCLLALSAALPARAGWDKSPSSPYDRMKNQKSVHVRYPGDVVYPFGTVHVRGGRKIPYVEKCRWTYQTGIFGLPRGLKQTCVRYTLENTAPRR